MDSTQLYDVIIIGGGAAGLMCASLIDKSKKTLLIEGNKALGRKILISGGGRCNFTNYDVSSVNFNSQNIHFSKSALSRYNSYEFIDLVEKYRIPFYEKKLGQLFCKKSARDIVEILEKECEISKTEIHLETKVEDVEFISDHYEIITNQGKYLSKKIVLAAGGLSFPALGATGIGYQIGKKFGHSLVETVPALVPLTLRESEDESMKDLAGVSLPVHISCEGCSFEDDLLFTHKGISGPAVLKVSLYWKPGTDIKINFFPNIDLNEEFERARKKSPKINLINFLKRFAPINFVQKWVEIYADQDLGNISDISNKKWEELLPKLINWSSTPRGTEGYRRAEVTRGGISTAKISSKTLESQLQSGLYFTGEVVDVTGWLGGYNFQWAWSSAYCVSQAINES